MEHNKLPIIGKSLIVGLLTGLVVVCYRLLLTQAEHFSFWLYAVVSGQPWRVAGIFVALAALGYGIGCLIKAEPMISGSGIPQVKGLLTGHFQYHWLRVLLAKFIGGAACLAAGLSLGREGPSIQLGACVAQGVGQFQAKSNAEKKLLIASGASAGLAVAFNAPLAGVVFAIEEVFKYFSPLILLSTMMAAISADFVARIIFGVQPIFHFAIESIIPLSQYWLLFVLGGLLGLFGASYNWLLLKIQSLYRRIPRLDPRLRPVIPMLMAGVLGFSLPAVLCGGSVITDTLDLSLGLGYLCLLFVVKLFFSLISFGSGVPGGIFFPLLVLGALLGAVFGKLAILGLGVEPSLFVNFVILAMAGYFTAIVRAPITGVILLLEMTGSFSQLLSLSVVALAAYVVADALKSTPIYESLLEQRIAEQDERERVSSFQGQVVMEMIVHYGAAVENRPVKELHFPECCLLVAIRRRGREIIPHGATILRADDYLIFLASAADEAQTRTCLQEITTAG